MAIKDKKIIVKKKNITIFDKDYKGVYIADIHFGSKLPSKTLYEHLEEKFISYLCENVKEIDYIVIAGDTLDSKVSLNGDDGKYAIMFFNFLDNFSYSEHIPVYVLKGTKTHDYNQLDSFFDKTLVNPYFHIINTVTVEEILPNFNVLFLPEEYMEDQDAYYKEYKKKSNTYDMIIGHGTWDVFAFENQITESERNIKGSPVFKYKEWENRVHGNIIFGHINVHNVHKKLIYPGSFYRWCFGEATE